LALGYEETKPERKIEEEGRRRRTEKAEEK
jgi:hypothetical protein